MVAAVLPAMALDLTWSKYNLNFSVPEGGFELLNTSCLLYTSPSPRD